MTDTWRPERFTLAGIFVDRITLDEVLRLVKGRVSRCEGGLIITPNVSIARRMQGGDYGAIRQHVILWLLDGVPLGWLLRVQSGTKLPRVAGSDLLVRAAEVSADSGLAVAILGAGAEECLQTLRVAHPGAKLYGGELPFADADSSDLLQAASSLLPPEPSLVFVCLGFPKQELLSQHLLSIRPDCVYVGAGGAPAMASGVKRRAPRLFQVAGMEWAWRLMLEPMRLGPRYLLRDAPWLLRTILAAALIRLRSEVSFR